jgi:hypothetical protein
MRFTLLIIAASLFLVACGRHNTSQDLSGDAKLRHEIVGTWFTTEGVITYLPDGHSLAGFTNVARELAYETTWAVSNGDIIVTVTNITGTTTNHEPVGSVERIRVVSIDSTNMVWDDYHHNSMMLKRKP